MPKSIVRRDFGQIYPVNLTLYITASHNSDREFKLKLRPKRCVVLQKGIKKAKNITFT